MEVTRGLVALEAEDAFLRWQEASLQVPPAREAAEAGDKLADDLTRDYTAGLKVRTDEVVTARVLAAQVSFLGGEPTTVVRDVPVTTGSRGALEADLHLEQEQLERYRERFGQANELGLADVGEALRPLLEQTQEHVQDLLTALGR